MNVGVSSKCVEFSKLDAEKENAPARSIEAWEAIKKWLELDDEEEIGPDEFARIERAVKAYYVIGIAPFHKQQPKFSKTSQTFKAEGYDYKNDKPPKEVLDAFDWILGPGQGQELKQKG